LPLEVSLSFIIEEMVLQEPEVDFGVLYNKKVRRVFNERTVLIFTLFLLDNV
jgi:hypothetical protein